MIDEHGDGIDVVQDEESEIQEEPELTEEEIKLMEQTAINESKIVGTNIKPLVDPVIHGHCRICLFSKNNIELYNWFTHKAMAGYPYGKIATEAIKYMGATCPDIKPPTRKSIWVHFEKHLPIKDAARLLSARRDFMPNGDMPLVSPAVIKQLGTGNFDEYKELCALYVKFREVHDKIYERADALQNTSTDGTKNSVWSQSKIATYTTMINTQKSILSEISKMRQSNKLISVATKYIIETYTKNIVTKLMEEFSGLVSIMRRQNVNSDIIDAFEEITSTKLANILVNEAEEAMDQTKSEFKLPN